MSPLLIGEAMSKDDPFYRPSKSNPFASMADFCDGRKILGKSFGDVYYTGFELPSPSSPTTPPCTPIVHSMSNSVIRRRSVTTHRKSQSLPSSPVLLRKAAERLHLESIHGSNSKRTLNPNRYSFCGSGRRSKSVFFPEAVAQKLQFEFFDTGSPCDGRSRESSVESEVQYNLYKNGGSSPHNLSAGDRANISIISQRNENLQSSVTFNNDSIKESWENVDEKGDKSVHVEFSIYPGLSYAKSSDIDQNHNNNNVSSSSYVSCEETFSSLSSNSELESSDPWSMKCDISDSPGRKGDYRNMENEIRETSV